MKARLLCLLVLVFLTGILSQDFNYDEAKVPGFELPDPLMLSNGERVTDVSTWENQRRPEIYTLFAEHVYGKVPNSAKATEISYELLESSTDALGGTATRKQVRVFLLGDTDGPFMDVLIYLPNNREAAAPLFVGHNFYGNHTIVDDPAVRLSESWVRNNENFNIFNNKATEASRGVRTHRWPLRDILERGYGVATIYYGDIDPDDNGNFDNGIHPYFYSEGQTQPAPDEWGAIAAWAWGLSRALDYFAMDADINENQVAVMGHSRLGKTSLWAGAMDERFALVISNDSGCGGAALSRRRFGETVERINTVFPHWFADNFNQYNNNEGELPVDQHMLFALMAPRPVYVASAAEDLWADPRGEFLSAKYASPVYELYGLTGLPAEDMPALGDPVMGTIGYHIRPGKHDITLYDWDRYMDFADSFWKN